MELLTDKEIEVINKLAQMELMASNAYLYLSNCMKSKGFLGASKFFLNESNSERGHYGIWSDFLNNLGVEIDVREIEGYEDGIDGLSDAVAYALEMEADLLKKYEEACESNVSMKVKIQIYDFIEIQVKSVGEYLDLSARLDITNEPILIDQELDK